MDIAILPLEVQDYIKNLEAGWEKKYNTLEEQYKLLLLQKFGRKSEKESLDPNQNLLFMEETTTEI